MEHVVLLTLLTLLSMAFPGAVQLQDADTECAAMVPQHDPDTDASITVTLVNEFTVPYAAEALDLGWLPSGYLIFSSVADQKIYACDASTGAYVDALDAYDTNPAPYGLTSGPSGSILTTNDYTRNTLFTWSGTAWTESSNPAGIYGRGLEYEPTSTAFWEAASTPGGQYLYRFVPGGSSSFYAIPLPTSLLAGIAVFPLGSGLGIVVSGRSDLNFYVYQYVGTTLTYVGSAPCPPSPYPVQYSLGMTYAPSRGTFFWSDVDAQGYAIHELVISIDLALEPATWGSIKTLF
jgi:hypothetical protein